ncbi:MAG: ABC transporter ATP-binding protein [Chitinophagaceae bacterium]|nr:ABC transporter ATP-binding protein [Chitinophagaceae bacterium]
MKINATNAGKRFNRDWIFRHFNYEFVSGKAYAITGPNGSGKSTLLQVIAGAIAPSEGKVKYEVTGYRLQVAGNKEQDNNENDFYRHISIAAPYLEVIEEMTANEFLEFHGQFKPLLNGHSVHSILSEVGLEHASQKQIRYYSSGMKQRIKLAQAFFSDTPVVLLDEPCTNLDAEGIELYHQLISNHCKNRLVLVSSNDEVEYRFCGERISIVEYKT